jgi:hypothetical protein
MPSFTTVAGHCGPSNILLKVGFSPAFISRPLDEGKPGAPGRTRTCNPRLRRPMLYPVELRAHYNGRSVCQTRKSAGRGREIRTPDPLLPKQMRYQTAPCPDSGIQPRLRPGPGGGTIIRPGTGAVNQAPPFIGGKTRINSAT